MIYGNETWYCNACGKQQWSSPVQAMGRDFRCCSMECVREMNERYTRSVTAKPEKPHRSHNPGVCRSGAGYDQFVDCQLPDGHDGPHVCGAWEWKD